MKEVYRLSGTKPEELRKQKFQALDITLTTAMITCSESKADLISNNSRSGVATISSKSSSNGDVTINGIPYPKGAEPGLLRHPIHHIILDFSGIMFTDTVGCKVLKQMIIDYESVDIQVYLADVSDEVWEVFIATEVIPTYQNNTFLTVDDAVAATRRTYM